MKLKQQKGFTLIELIMVAIILSILSVIAIPIYVDSRQEARDASEQGVAAAVRVGILTFFSDPSRGNLVSYPTDAQFCTAPVGDCTAANPCFVGVLGQGGITSNWTKLSANTWRSSANGTNVWTYVEGVLPTGGTFTKTTN